LISIDVADSVGNAIVCRLVELLFLTSTLLVQLESGLIMDLLERLLGWAFFGRSIHVDIERGEFGWAFLAFVPKTISKKREGQKLVAEWTIEL